MATKDRVRGMNAALSSGEAGVGEMRPARAPLRPRQLLVAAAAVAVGAAAVVTTYRAMADPAPAVTGQVTPAHAYYLNFGGDGTLTALNVRPGQQVKAGQVLATEDTTVAASDLQAAQALVQADTTELAAAQNPQASTAQQNQAKLAAAKAQSAVSSAQSALTLAQSKAKSSTDLQASVVAGRQKILDSDNARLTAACAPPGASTPTPSSPTTTKATSAPPTSDAALCQSLQAQVVRDSSSLSDAQSQLASIQFAVEGEQQRDADQLTQAQSLQQTVLSQSSAAVAPAAVTVAQAKSQLAASQAQVAKDEQALKDASITAPADGTVADTAGAVGDQVRSDGIRLYQGPPGQSGAAGGGQQQGFQLFAGQPTAGAGSGSGANQQAGYQPLITLYSEPFTVTAQVPEANIGKIHTGQQVTLTVAAVNGTVRGTVDKVLLDPARVSSGVYYDVVISMAATPPGVLCGMTVNVGLTS
ncbi:multidrug efflux pump subunit AcrA (membrane-fusion protein) [Catenulispora sp. MAP5-51]|uniref:HlyD family efflux transporter periplasmic adaptor subunit n=1 Tax=Catenulispora sp. MAP5-51 TaxID=3156298 RepID=UPI00351121A0